MKKIFMLLFVLFLFGCDSMPVPFFGEKVSKLDPGTTKSDVYEKIGRPDSFEDTSNGTVIKYIHRQVSAWSYQYTDYYLFFDRKDKLVAIKNGSVKDNTANVQRALNSYNNNLNTQRQLQIQEREQLSNALNQNKVQKVIICKQGDLMCY